MPDVLGSFYAADAVGLLRIVSLPMQQFFTAQTATLAIPPNCVIIQAGLLGAGAGGISGSPGVGGSGAEYIEFLRVPTSGATIFTLIIGAGGAANTNGAATSASDGTWVYSAQAGNKGNGGTAAAAPIAQTPSYIIGVGGVYLANTGGASGASSSGNSGGGAPGNPAGTGGASGTTSSSGAASGGGGLRAKSGDAGSSASGGAGNWVASAGGGTTGGGNSINIGVGTVPGGPHVWASGNLPMIYQALLATGAGGTNTNAGQPGGGGGGIAAGGLGAGGGGGQSNVGGPGGMFGGGGGGGGNTGGKGGNGAGGGGGSTGNAGGDGYAWVVFWVKV